MNLSRIPIQEYLNKSGVYILYSGDKVVYVGQSRHVPSRILRHVSDGRLTFDSVVIVHVEPQNLLEEESRYIDKLFPEANRTGERARIEGILSKNEESVAIELAMLDSTDKD